MIEVDCRRLLPRSENRRSLSRIARLWRDQGKFSEARDLIAPIYGWFNEGFETVDLAQANALLSEFSR